MYWLKLGLLPKMALFSYVSVNWRAVFLKKLLAPSGTFPSFVPISENKWTLTITILQMYFKYVMCEVRVLSDSCIVSFTLLQGSGSCKDAHEDVFGRT